MRLLHPVRPAILCCQILILWCVPSLLDAADEPLEARLLPLVRAHQGQVAVAVRHLESGEAFQYRANEVMPTASLIKFPVMIEAYRQIAEGQLKAEQLLILKAADKVPGSGILTSHFSPGLAIPLRDAIQLMIAFSDNTATNLVLDQIGLRSTGDTMGRYECPNTRIHAKVFRSETSISPERSQKFGLGSTTAAEMLRLLERLHRRELVSAAACESMLAHLKACDDKEKFAADLPAGTVLAHKTGAVGAIRTDAGILETPAGPVALCVLTSQNKDQRWVPENAGNVLCANIARAVFDYFNTEEGPESTEPQVLQLGANGELVETLQRTLNGRLKPTPRLTVDGDFGTTTQTAVIRFQKDRKLPATGIVTPEVWQALAPLIQPRSNVPPPDVINAEVLPLHPADSMSGPPVVTAKAWAALDVKSRRLIGHSQGDQRLPMASTTKIMTAIVVLQQVGAQSERLDEVLEFSSRADRTGGSTSGIRAGERVPLRELLYGLLLPSGNDAAIALAEHFGPRCAPPADAPEAKDPVIRFVAEMNRTAKKLGLKNTHFTNPHGLPDRAHYSTARELLLIGLEATRYPLIMECTGTRQRGCRLTGPEGYERNIVWKNTNELLEIEGYRGLKTGTTNAAGSCLISMGEFQGRRLMVVVLGCSTSTNRYLDTRNLFKWAWSQR